MSEVDQYANTLHWRIIEAARAQARDRIRAIASEAQGARVACLSLGHRDAAQRFHRVQELAHRQLDSGQRAGSTGEARSAAD